MSFMFLMSKISLPSNPVNRVNPVKIPSAFPPIVKVARKAHL